VISRRLLLATVTALFAVTALLLFPATALAAHPHKKAPPGQAKKQQRVLAPTAAGPTTRTVVVVQRVPVFISRSPAPASASVPSTVTQPVAAPTPAALEPVVPGPLGGIGARPVVTQPRPPVSIASPAPPAITTAPGAVVFAVPYETMGVVTGASGTVLLLLLLLAIRRPRLGAAHQALARELGLRPRQLAALTAITAEGVLDRVRSGREVAMLDDLTGVLRRGPGMAALEREVARAQRSLLGRLVVGFIDVDGLKEVNDTRGHAAGDQLLRSVATALSSRLRGQDLVLRYGGDEFVVVMPETDIAGARQTLLEIRSRLQERIERRPFSIGLAALRQGDGAQSLVERADSALYENRRLGLS
jgi:diguanylate cyclase (GGDEF)-like protein